MEREAAMIAWRILNRTIGAKEKIFSREGNSKNESIADRAVESEQGEYT